MSRSPAQRCPGSTAPTASPFDGMDGSTGAATPADPWGGVCLVPSTTRNDKASSALRAGQPLGEHVSGTLLHKK